MLKLATIEEHVKNYRPQVLVLSGNPVARTTLVDFVRNITKGSSLMICGHVVPNIPNDQALSYMRNVDEQMNEWLRRRRVKAFYVSTVNQSLRAGVRTLLQVAGLGKLRPNIVFMGFKADWTTCGPEGINDINEYFGVILDSFDSNMGMAILSNAGGGLDLSEMMKRHKVGDTKRLKLPDVNEPEITSANVKWNEEIINESTSSNPQSSLLGSTSNKDVSDAAANEYTSSFMESVVEDGAENEKASVAPANSFYVVVDDVTPKVSNEMDLQSVTDEPTRRSQRPTAVQRDVFASINRFNRSKAKSTAATIDVWWLYDDGGLTLLIPHLLALPKSYLAGAKLRVFTIASSRMAIEQEQRSMLALLNKFRINVSHVVVLPEITGKPSSTTLEKWESLIAPFRVDDANLDNEGLIKETELSALRGRTNRQLRCRELLLEHSTNANLIVVTLPVPRKGQISSCLYMAWLDVLTRDLPPTLLIRGNQTSVLTFYS
uniref:SLC12A transporter C-terminal domain-containing protein n=1 Tax=Plectus sambesii TaxID=2011161 RepID=A0A914VMZ8_9BILA